MSTKYKESKEIPMSVLCKRLDELASAVAQGPISIAKEFYMSVPAELDTDADMVLTEASERLEDLHLELSNNVPMVPGFYWMKERGAELIIVEVIVKPGYKYLCIYANRLIHHKRYPIMIHSLDAEWAGPINYPTGL